MGSVGGDIDRSTSRWRRLPGASRAGGIMTAAVAAALLWQVVEASDPRRSRWYLTSGNILAVDPQGRGVVVAYAVGPRRQATYAALPAGFPRLTPGDDVGVYYVAGDDSVRLTAPSQEGLPFAAAAASLVMGLALRSCFARDDGVAA